MPTVLTVLLLSLAGCRDKEVVVEVIDTAVTDSATTDSVPEVDEPEMCTQDEFCDAMLECFSIMGEALCESYFQNGMGMCNGASEEVMEEFHTCMCGCWTSEDDRSCMGMGTCSDWCTTRICMAG